MFEEKKGGDKVVTASNEKSLTSKADTLQHQSVAVLSYIMSKADFLVHQNF